MQKRNFAAKSVAVAVAFSMAFSMSAGIKADAAKKKPALNQSKLTLEKGETFKLKVVKNKNKISKVTWKSTNADVASVSKKGLVTGQDAGKATIKATFKVKKKKTTLKCKVTVTDNQTLAGGWEVPESPVVSAELADLVKQFYEKGAQSGKGNVSVTPFALLGTQVVNGTGYRVLCRADLGADATGKNRSSYSIVQIYADLSGALVADASKLLAYTDDFASETIAVSGSSTSIVGEFTQFDDPTIPAEWMDKFEKFYAEKNIPFPYKPVARLAARESTGKYEVSLVCTKGLTSSGNVGTDEKTGYFVIKMDIDKSSDKHTATAGMFYPISFVDTDYSVCIDKMPAVDVETQAAFIRSFILGAANNDTESISSLATKISYPVTIDGNEVKSPEELMVVFSTGKLSADFVLAIRKTTCMQMFANAQGIMLGDGEHTLWLNQDPADKTQIKITAVNGMFEKK